MGNIVIKLKYPKNGIYEKGIEDFWGPFYDTADRLRGTPTNDRINNNRQILEGRLRTNFSHELKKYLTTFTPPISTVGLEAKTNLSASIAISVDYIREGSLELGLIIEPIEKLSKLFDGNFDYFETFLKSYIPIAFLDALRPQSQANYVGWGDVVNQLEVELIPSNDFRTRFQITNQRQITQMQASAVVSKANWLWIVSNTSLVVPVIISLCVLYVSFERLTTREATLERRIDQIIEQQNKLIERLLLLNERTKTTSFTDEKKEKSITIKTE